jgi:hypothetical protein
MALSISKAWDETRAILGKDGKLVVVVVAALVMLPVALNTMIDPAPAMPATSAEARTGNPLGLLVLFITLIGQVAVTAIGLKAGTSVGEAIGIGARKFLPVLGAAFLLFLPMVILLMIILAAAFGSDEMLAMQQRLAAGQMDGSLVLVVLVWAALFLLVAVRLCLTVPIAIAETSNPVSMLQRSWAITKGHFWKIFGFVALLAIATLVVMLAASSVFGIIVELTAGTPEPMSLAGLLLGLMAGAVQAAFVAIYMLMLARIYAQLAPATATAAV